MSTYSFSGNTYTDKTNLVDKIDASHVNNLQDEVEIVEAAISGGTPGEVFTAGATGKGEWAAASGGGGFPTGAVYYGASPVQDIELDAEDSGKVYYFSSPVDQNDYHEVTLPSAEDGLIFSFITTVRATYKSLKINAQSGESIRAGNVSADHTYDRVDGIDISRMAIVLVGIADDSFTGWVAISETSFRYKDGEDMKWCIWYYDPPPP